MQAIQNKCILQYFVVFGEVREKNVFFQITNYGKGGLACSYKHPKANVFSEFSTVESYFEGYAECGAWSKNNNMYKIKLTLNGKEYHTNETKALQLKRHPIIGKT